VTINPTVLHHCVALALIAIGALCLSRQFLLWGWVMVLLALCWL
jgi:hypothetical protein